MDMLDGVIAEARDRQMAAARAMAQLLNAVGARVERLDPQVADDRREGRGKGFDLAA